jgi:hypothetical protein
MKSKSTPKKAPKKQKSSAIDIFRRLALSLPEAIESAHMGHPDFRVGGKIFATLHYPGDDSGAVMLTPEQQRFFVQQAPAAFEPVAGGWGLRGATHVRLTAADENVLFDALKTAWRNKAPQRLAKKGLSMED